MSRLIGSAGDEAAEQRDVIVRHMSICNTTSFAVTDVMFSKQVVFVAALAEGDGPVRSDIPFVVATNGPAVATAYGVQDDFTLVIIGRDGNLDYQTTKVCPPERVRDVIQNSFEVQSGSRSDP